MKGRRPTQPLQVYSRRLVASKPTGSLCLLQAQ